VCGWQEKLSDPLLTLVIGLSERFRDVCIFIGAVQIDNLLANCK